MDLNIAHEFKRRSLESFHIAEKIANRLRENEYVTLKLKERHCGVEDLSIQIMCVEEQISTLSKLVNDIYIENIEVNDLLKHQLVKQELYALYDILRNFIDLIYLCERQIYSLIARHIAISESGREKYVYYKIIIKEYTLLNQVASQCIMIYRLSILQIMHVDSVYPETTTEESQMEE